MNLIEPLARCYAEDLLGALPQWSEGDRPANVEYFEKYLDTVVREVECRYLLSRYFSPLSELPPLIGELRQCQAMFAYAGRNEIVRQLMPLLRNVLNALPE